MGKTAKLVSFIVTTRVVINESGNRDIDEERAYDEAREKIMANAREYLIWDNLESVSDDTEVPYNEKYDR